MSQKTFFPNGYGVSILSSEFSYGLEMAVLIGTEDNHAICYDTPITGDVLGHLDEQSLADAVQSVKELPSVMNEDGTVTIPQTDPFWRGEEGEFKEEEEVKPIKQSKSSLPHRGEFIGE